MKLIIFLLPLLLLLLTGCDTKPAAKPQVESWPLVKDCNLHQTTCTARHGNQSVTLDITPKPIPVAKPLQVKVTLNHLQAKQMQIDISGHNMYMGYNRLPLEKVNEQHWQGTTMLAFCTSAKMEWHLTLLIDTPDGKQLQIPFYLETRSR